MCTQTDQAAIIDYITTHGSSSKSDMLLKIPGMYSEKLNRAITNLKRKKVGGVLQHGDKISLPSDSVHKMVGSRLWNANVFA